MATARHNEYYNLEHDDMPGGPPHPSSSGPSLAYSLSQPANDVTEIEAHASEVQTPRTAPAILSHVAPPLPSHNPRAIGTRDVNAARAHNAPPFRLPPRPSLAKKKKPTKGRGTRKLPVPGGRVNGFTQKEIDCLLDLLEEHLPVGREEWLSVQKQQNSRFPELEINSDSLKRKFAGLYRKTVPTGDPNIPPDVRRAKIIRSKMVERIDMGDGHDAEQIADEFFAGADTMPDLPESTADASEPDADSATAAPISNDQSRTTSQPDRITPSPRPLVRRRPGVSEEKGDDLVSIYKLSMVEDQKRRAEEHQQRLHEREEDRLRRDEEHEARRVERAEERERRADENKRHERLMEMMTVMSFGRSQPASNSAPFQGGSNGQEDG